MRNYISIILFICTSFRLLGQVPVEELSLMQYDISNGLSENIAISILEDSKGYIWIGTLDGLNKFDGTNFKAYRDELFVESISSNNRIYQIHQDHNDNLLVVKDEGAILFDPITEQMISNNLMLNNKVVLMSTIDSSNSWVFTNFNELMQVDSNYEPISCYQLEKNQFCSDPEGSCWINELVQIKDNSIFLTTNQGDVLLFNPEKGKHSFYKSPIPTSRNYLATIKDHQNNIWMCSRDGKIVKFDTQSYSFQQFDQYLGIENLNCNYSLFDPKSKSVLFSTRENGILEYSIEDNNWNSFEVKAPGKQSLKSEKVLGFYRDSKDVLWLGTDQHGVLIHDPHLKKFESIKPMNHGFDWDIRMPRKIVGDDYGNIWIGTNTLGLWKYNQQKDELINFTSESTELNLQSNSAVMLMADKDKLYVGHNGKGISVIDIPSLKLEKQIKLKSDHPKVIASNVIWNIFKEGDNLWVGTRQSGLFIIDESGKQKNFNSYNCNLTQNDIQTINQLSSGRIIIATRLGGLYEWQDEIQDFKKIYPRSQQEIISPKSIHEDKEGNIWIGTDGKGVTILDKNYDLKEKITTKSNLLKSDVICSFLEDKDGSMWISTNNGISKLKFDKNSNSYISNHYAKNDGLLSDEFMTGAYYNDGERMWMGNISGVNYFYPNQLANNPYLPDIALTNFEIFSNTFETDTCISDLVNVELAPGQNNLSFEFTTKGFSIPDKTYYSYRLVGYDKNWSKANNRKYANYTNLNPGKYTFQVKGTNYDGLWSENPYELDINIKPKLSQTPLFQALTALALLLILVIFYRYRIGKEKEKNRLKIEHDNELTQMEMKALRAQINPHFLFNTLNSINNYILQKDEAKASSYLVKFSQLMRKMLSNSSNSFISLAEELRTLELYIQLERMRFANKFDYFINVDKDLDLDNLMIPPMLLQPFVENAIWHGLLHKEDNNCLEINIAAKNKETLVLSVRDNGIGMENSQRINKGSKKGKSFGMDITKKRIELINKEFDKFDNKSKIEINNLKDENNIAMGTEINVFVPKIYTEATVEI